MLTFIRKILNLHDYPMCSLLLILKMSSSLRTKKKQCCTLVHIIFQIVIYIENFLKSYKNLKKYLSFFCKKKKRLLFIFKIRKMFYSLLALWFQPFCYMHWSHNFLAYIHWNWIHSIKSKNVLPYLWKVFADFSFKSK